MEVLRYLLNCTKCCQTRLRSTSCYLLVKGNILILLQNRTNRNGMLQTKLCLMKLEELSLKSYCQDFVVNVMLRNY